MGNEAAASWFRAWKREIDELLMDHLSAASNRLISCIFMRIFV